MTTNHLYFGFALADSMFNNDVRVVRTVLSPKEAKEVLDRARKVGALVSCVNPSHVPTLSVARERFGLEFSVPEVAPKVELHAGDSLLVMTVQGLPRLNAGQHEYSPEQIEGARFTFALWSVIP